MIKFAVLTKSKHMLPPQILAPQINLYPYVVDSRHGLPPKIPETMAKAGPDPGMLVIVLYQMPIYSTPCSLHHIPICLESFLPPILSHSPYKRSSAN